VLGAGSARAIDNTDTNFVASRFQPVGGIHDVLAVQAARVGPDGRLATWAYLDYATGLLRLQSSFTGNTVNVLSPRVSLNLGGTYVFMDDYEVSLVLPFALYQGGTPAPTVSPSFANAPPSFAFGDVVLSGKAHVYTFGDFDFGAGLRLSVPSGTHGAYMSYTGLTVQPQIMVEYANLLGVRIVGNTGVAVRPSREFDYASIGTAWTYGIAGDWPFLWTLEELRIVASVQGELVFNDVTQFGSPLELMLAALYRVNPAVNVSFGVGKGLTNGYGVPLVRVLAGVTYTPILEAAVGPSSAAAPAPTAVVPDTHPSQNPAPSHEAGEHKAKGTKP